MNDLPEYLKDEEERERYETDPNNQGVVECCGWSISINDLPEYLKDEIERERYETDLKDEIERERYETDPRELKRALIVKSPWIKLILSGKKTWEMRSRPTNIRERIGLIEQGTGLIVGACKLEYCSRVMFTNWWLERTIEHHRIPREIFANPDFKWRYAWLISEPEKFEKPIPYIHPRGATTWVKL